MSQYISDVKAIQPELEALIATKNALQKLYEEILIVMCSRPLKTDIIYLGDEVLTPNEWSAELRVPMLLPVYKGKPVRDEKTLFVLPLPKLTHRLADVFLTEYIRCTE